MRFDWDERKNEINRRKHGVAFATASIAFDDPYALAQVDLSSEEEQR